MIYLFERIIINGYKLYIIIWGSCQVLINRNILSLLRIYNILFPLLEKTDTQHLKLLMGFNFGQKSCHDLNVCLQWNNFQLNSWLNSLYEARCIGGVNHLPRRLQASFQPSKVLSLNSGTHRIPQMVSANYIIMPSG